MSEQDDPTPNTPSFALRPPRREELGGMAQMSRDLVEQGLGWKWRKRAIAKELARDDALGVVACAAEGEHLLGFAMMRLTTESAHLVLLAVDPRARRQGIGAALIEYIETLARTGGAFRLSLEVREQNEGARAFYASLGYRELALRRGYYRGREHAVRMQRDLSRPPHPDFSQP